MKGAAQILASLITLVVIDQGQTAATHGNRIEAESRYRLTRRSVDTSRTAGIAWNDVVDLIFSIAKKDILQLEKDEIPLPDVRQQFREKYGFITVNGQFLANQGKLSNITSFHRTDDVSVVKMGTSWRMTCVFSLEVLKVRYEHYEVNILGVGPKGFIEGTVGSNSIRMILDFARKEGGCESTLDEVKVTELSDVSVNVSGLGPFNSLGSNIATWIVEQRKENIVTTIERVLSREAKKALENFYCDEYASLLML